MIARVGEPRSQLLAARGSRFEPRRSNRRIGWLLAVAALLTYGALCRDFGPEGFWVPWKALLLAGLLLSPAASLACQPVTADSRLGAQGGSVPVLALLGAIHALYYALPPLIGDRVVGMLVEPNARGLERALDLCLLGWFGFAVGYRILAWPRPAGRPKGWDVARATSLMWFALPAGLLAESALRAGVVPGSLLQPAKLLALFLQLGLGLAILLLRRGELARRTALPLLVVGVPLFLLTSLSEGAIGAAVKSGSFLLALIWATGGRIPLLALVSAGALALVLRGGAMEFRTLAKQHPHLVAEGGLERALTFVKISADELERDGGRRSLETILDRISQVALFGHVVDATPLAVPYWNGATYASLPASLVPRFLWPDKPVKDLGQRFGHRYAVLDPEDRNTSINFPQLIEMYCNFGAAGVLCGMLAFGLFCRLLADRLYRVGVGPAAMLLGAIWLGSLTNVESDLSLVLGGMLQQALVVGPLLLWARGRRGPVLQRGPRQLVGRSAL